MNAHGDRRSGKETDGTVPEDPPGKQIDVADNILRKLRAANMEVTDIVKIKYYQGDTDLQTAELIAQNCRDTDLAAPIYVAGLGDRTASRDRRPGSRCGNVLSF
jgi:hypothetical protein